jgi:hypothetical protein
MTAEARADEGRAEIVRRLAEVPDRLAVASGSAIGRPVPEGEWGPTEVVRHLIAVEESVWLARLTTLAAGEKPTWPWVEPAPWEGSPGASLDDLLARFAHLRSETLAILNGFDHEGWSRTGIHATWGEVDVATLMTKALDHDDEHIAGFATQ